MTTNNIKFESLRRHVNNYLSADQKTYILKRARKNIYLVFVKGEEEIYYFCFNESNIPNHGFFRDLRNLDIMEEISKSIGDMEEFYYPANMLRYINQYSYYYKGSYKPVSNEDFLNFIEKMKQNALLKEIIE